MFNTVSSFEKIYDILPSSLDDGKISHIQRCVYVWNILSIFSISISILSLCLVTDYMIVSILSFMVFSTAFIYSVYNFIQTRWYLQQILILKSLTEV